MTHFFPIPQPNVLSKKKKLTKEEIKEQLPKDLVKNVSHYVGTLAENHIFYNKTIIIKDEDKTSLQTRLHEVMKYETENYVIFGVFSSNLKSPSICKAQCNLLQFFFFFFLDYKNAKIVLHKTNLFSAQDS